MRNNLSLLIAPLHYCPSPDEGSEYTRAYDYLHSLASRDDLSGDVLVAFMAEQYMGNFRIHSMMSHKPNYISIALRLRFIIWVYIKGIFLLSKKQYDLIWHNGPFALGETFSLLILSWRRKIPIVVGPVVSPHTFLAADEARSMGQKGQHISHFSHLIQAIDRLFYPLRILTSHLSSRTIQHAHLVIAKDSSAYKLIQKLQPRKLKQLTIGPNVRAFYSQKPRIFVNRKKKSIISVGYLVRRKDYITVIKSIHHLVNNLHCFDVKLQIIGDGPERSKLEYLVKRYKLQNTIIFLGHVPKNEIYLYYKNSDIFVSGSLSESMPAMYLEAMASSLPLVIADNSTAQELNNRSFGGIVTPLQDYIKMAEALRLLLTDEHTYNRLSIRNYDLSRTTFNYDRQINKLVKTLYVTSKEKLSL